MEEKTVLEGNRLIAVFHGYREIKDYDGWEYAYTAHPTINVAATGDMDLKYHRSWDWIMPVVTKIRGLLDRDTDSYKEVKAGWVPIANELQNCNLEAVWYCVFQFIKWYNANTANK